MSTKKRGPNLTNSCFGGPPVANFLASITEARDNLANVLANILWSFFPGAPQAWPDCPSLDTQTPASYATSSVLICHLGFGCFLIFLFNLI
jgi:hypothetical protein